MEHRAFIKQLDEPLILRAIREAESHTTGEIRVCISRRLAADAQNAARERFHHLGMHQTRHRNAVLLWFAPLSQTFAVIGDEAIHAKCGDELWKTTVAEVEHRLRAGHFTDAVLAGIHHASRALARHFPADGPDSNELPDEVVRD